MTDLEIRQRLRDRLTELKYELERPGQGYAELERRLEGFTRGQIRKYVTGETETIPAVFVVALHRAGIVDVRYLLLGEGTPEVVGRPTEDLIRWAVASLEEVRHRLQGGDAPPPTKRVRGGRDR